MKFHHTSALLIALVLFGCSDDENPIGPVPLDPDTAPVVSVDRFSDDAGTLFVRSSNSALPAADAPINFDQAPFITRGLSPEGASIRYYNFDVMPRDPAPIFVLFRDGESTPVADQLNIIDVLPGQTGYNDFWHVHRVTVPSDYVANTVTSKSDIDSAGFEIAETTMIVNCPVVPDGSTATLRAGGETNGLVRGWYRDQVVKYFVFEEASLSPSNGMVPISPIYVAFNLNPSPDNPDSGPPSGFVTESGSDQTHNVVATLPSDGAYSPLWSVNVYDNADFGSVMNLSTAMSANILATGVADVNCPIVDTP